MKWTLEIIDHLGKLLERKDMSMKNTKQGYKEIKKRNTKAKKAAEKVIKGNWDLWMKVDKQKASKRPVRDQMELWRNHENRIKKIEKTLREQKKFDDMVYEEL